MGKIYIYIVGIINFAKASFSVGELSVYFAAAALFTKMLVIVPASIAKEYRTTCKKTNSAIAVSSPHTQLYGEFTKGWCSPPPMYTTCIILNPEFVSPKIVKINF